MYKLAILIVFLLTNGATWSQESISDLVIYTEVVKVDSNLKSSDLYTRARAWFAETYKSAQDVIQMDDKASGQIIGKGNIKYNSNVFVGSEGTKGWISYKIIIQFKDGRYKYEITDFYHEGNPYNTGGQFSFKTITTDEECPYKVGSFTGKGWRNKVWNDIKERITSQSTLIIVSLKSAMNKPAKNKDADW